MWNFWLCERWTESKYWALLDNWPNILYWPSLCLKHFETTEVFFARALILHLISPAKMRLNNIECEIVTFPNYSVKKKIVLKSLFIEHYCKCFSLMLEYWVYNQKIQNLMFSLPNIIWKLWIETQNVDGSIHFVFFFFVKIVSISLYWIFVFEAKNHILNW